MPGSTWLKVVMNVILIVCILIIVFIGEKTECQGAEEGGALDSWAGPWPPLAAAGPPAPTGAG